MLDSLITMDRSALALSLRVIVFALGISLGDLTAAPDETERAPVLSRAAAESELRQSGVDAIFQDRDHFLWFGTREGLVRWDGFTARHWHAVPFEPTSLGQNVVVKIDQDSQGHLWVITRPHIFGSSRPSRLVAPEFESFVHYSLEEVVLAVDAAGRPWLADSTQIYRFVPERDRFETWMTRSEPRPSRDSDAAFDGQGALWLAGDSWADRCRLDRQECRTFELASAPRVPPRIVPFQNKIRVTTARGLLCFDDARERFDPCPNLAKQPAAALTTAASDAAGNLWLASLEGVWRVSESKVQPVPVHSPVGAAGDDIYTLLGDHAGGMWAGTPWGLLHWDPHRPPFELLSLGDRSPGARSSAPIMSMHEDSFGTLWIGTIGDGLFSLDSDSTWRHYPERLWAQELTSPVSFVWSIASHGQHVWLATTYGLVRLDRVTGRATLVELSLPQERDTRTSGIRKVLVDTRGTLWAMTYTEGLFRFATGSNGRTEFSRPERIFHEPGATVEDLVIHQTGLIWLATGDDGLRRVDPTSGVVHAFRHDPSDPSKLSANGVFSLFIDSRDQLWVGTTSGLDRLAEDGESFGHILGPDDLPSSAVLAILEGPQRLWLTTNRGLVSIDKEAAHTAGWQKSQSDSVTTWTIEDGIGNQEFNRGAKFRDREGRLYFGGDRGITHFQPRDIQPSTYRPPIRLGGLTLVSDRGTRRLEPEPEQTIEIAPDVTSFTFELATIDFSHPPANRFALKLVGVDSEWIDLGTRRAITYAGTPPGRYTLTARVSNSDQVWNERHLEVPLVVVPPFYQTPLFRIAGALAAGFGILGLGALMTRRRYRRQLRRLETERQRHEDRRRISRDLHDELGAGLTQIVLLSEKEIRQTQGDPETLKRIADGARRLIDSIREIIWSIDPEQDRLDRLSSRLRGAVSEALETADLAARLIFPERPPALPISPQLRRNVSLILREAVNNAIRHARANTVEVRFEHLDDHLKIEIADDGRGFDAEHLLNRPDVSPGNGLRNLKDRAQALGGAVTIESREGDGSRIQVRVPLRHPV